MKVKVFDCEHEKDLESEINMFLDSGTYDIIDIKYSVATAMFGEEQIYCFSALILYQDKKIQSPLKLYIFVILKEIFRRKHQS